MDASQSTESSVAPLQIASVNLLANPDFALGPAGWSLMGAPQTSIVTDTYGKAMKLTGRARVNDGVRQDIQSGLAAAGNGQQYVTRFRVKLTQPANVRAYIQLTDSQGTTKIQLAERSVRAVNQFVTVQGVAALSWQGSLSQARFYFQVGQLPEKVNPDYTIDDVLFERDSDGDALADSDEQSRGLLVNSVDSDGDGMPDGWEVDNGTNPLLGDAVLDSDGDGFSNVEEYWAATDPRDANSYPGKPANPNLSAKGCSILKYLALLPSNGSANRVIAGQHVTSSSSSDNQGYAYNVSALESQIGKNLGIVELQYDDDAAHPFQVAATNQLAEAIWNRGSLVAIKWLPWNPWTNGYFGDRNNVDIAGMFAANPTATNAQALATFNGYLDTVATGLEQLQQKNIVVVWRPMAEMNGAWFWWGRRMQAEYVAIWRHMYSYLTNTKHLNNLIWTYEGDSGVHDVTPSDYYFPGADAVDIVGHNLYSDTWLLPTDLDGLYREYGKVYAIPQAGSAGKSPVRLTQSGWDNMTIINGIKARHPRTSFFNVWNSFTTWDNVARASVTQYIAIVDQANASALMNDPWIVTRDEMP